MDLVRTRGTILSALCDSISSRDQFDHAVEMFAKLPLPISTACMRLLSSEVLTLMISVHKEFNSTVCERVVQSVCLLPKPLFVGIQGVYYDYSIRLQLELLKLKVASSEVPFHPDANSEVKVFPPNNWQALGEWASNAASLMTPQLQNILSVKLKKRDPDLSLSCCLATMQGQILKCSKILRWLPFMNKKSTEFQTMTELLNHIENCYSDDPDIRFHVVITKYFMHRSSYA